LTKRETQKTITVQRFFAAMTTLKKCHQSRSRSWRNFAYAPCIQWKTV